ncbi:hypothetical protein OESDEN_19480 [Oesophagostomum dentatum]|uniref:Uncharacterized protein n=1 Tax=Oesophagostomum dentatum TaxID=61180 RepID=A0A0B1SC86_OESDE|nr:hypothetical protein OESDEN_19480 [Oesophagostomum dentatum]
MTRRTTARLTSNADNTEEDFPSWAKELIPMVKFRADSTKIDEKLRTIAWVGIDEKVDEVSTRLFDREIVKEAVYTSGCDDLKREFDEGRISIRRHPSGRPHGPGRRGRIIKITLSNQSLRDALLMHMKNGRQSLTKDFVHSYPRRDYTVEELELDRSLRKQAGELNAQCGRLKQPRDLPIRPQWPRQSPSTSLNAERRSKLAKPNLPNLTISLSQKDSSTGESSTNIVSPGQDSPVTSSYASA